MNKVLCLDTNVLIAYLVPDENEPLADNLVLEAVVVNPVTHSVYSLSAPGIAVSMSKDTSLFNFERLTTD